MVSWARRRQYFIAGIITIVLSIPISYALFAFLYDSPTCFDKKQNSDEIGVDCGGSCSLRCESQVTDLIVLWSRALEVLPGVYDAVALVENPNFDSGIKQAKYSFTLFDKNNFIISERIGTTFVNPSERFVVFEAGIEAGGRVPSRTFLEFSKQREWVRIRNPKPAFSVRDIVLTEALGTPRVRANVVNNSLLDLRDVLFTTLLFDKSDNVIAASQTEIELLSKDESRDIFFTWPRPLGREPEVCVVPLDVMLVFDRSGSMNDDGGVPPQPLTNAKSAAQSFVETLSDKDQVGVVSFASDVLENIDSTLTIRHELAKKALSSINITQEEESGFTNLGAAIKSAREEFLSLRNNPDAKKVMVILTDGRANAPLNPGGEEFAEIHATRAIGENIITYVIGLGDKVNEAFLTESISGDKSRYYSAEKSSDLLGVYKEISKVACPERTYPLSVMSRVNITQ
jgi:hypothetical protein